MGSPISPLIANLFMEEFEVKALSTAPHPRHLLLRFVDDTLVIHKAEHSTQLLQHFNSQDPNIGSIPFLDTKVTPGPINSIHTKVYRKPTHTDQYIQWDSKHFITAKNSVYNTLAHRAKVVSSNPEDLAKEIEHLRKALKACQFSNWVLNRLQQQFELKHNNRDNNQTEGQPNNSNWEHNNNITKTSPWSYHTFQLGRKIQKNKQDFQVHFKGTNTIKQLLRAPKDRDPKLAKSGVC